MPSRRFPRASDLRHNRADARTDTRALPNPAVRPAAWVSTLAGGLLLAIAAAAAPVQSADRTSEGTAAQVASAQPERTLERISYGCGWAQKRLADPAWRPFLSRVTQACQAIADNPETRQITQQAYRERAFTAALDRAARGLDALYLEMWRIRLADESRTLGTVSLNNTGVFLALQHEGVFRLAERIVVHYDAGGRIAWLR